MINKILIVLLPVAAILIGILYYSNQKAEAPILENAESYNQYIADLKLPEEDTTFLAKHSYQQLYDSLHFYMTRMWVFRDEKKISKESHDVFYDDYLQSYTNAFDQKTDAFINKKKNNWPREVNDSIQMGLEWFQKSDAIYNKYTAIIRDYNRVYSIHNSVSNLDSKTGADNLINEITALQEREYIKNTTSLSNQLVKGKSLARQLKIAIDKVNEAIDHYNNNNYTSAESKLNEVKNMGIYSINNYIIDNADKLDMYIQRAKNNIWRY